MFDFIRKTIMAGIGGIGMLGEKADEALDELAVKGEHSGAAPARLVRTSLDTVSKWSEDAADRARGLRDDALEALNVPKRSEVDALKKKVDQLAKEV